VVAAGVMGPRARRALQGHRAAAVNISLGTPFEYQQFGRALVLKARPAILRPLADGRLREADLPPHESTWYEAPPRSIVDAGYAHSEHGRDLLCGEKSEWRLYIIYLIRLAALIKVHSHRIGSPPFFHQIMELHPAPT
jgi:hypothetical protein